MILRAITALVVDDDPAHRELAEMLLIRAGATVTAADNAYDALARLETSGCPDLILCDLRMPGVDGFEFAKRLRADSKCREVRLVALTAIRDPIVYSRSWSAGYDFHLDKPLTPEKLATLASVLSIGRRARS